MASADQYEVTGGEVEMAEGKQLKTPSQGGVAAAEAVSFTTSAGDAASETRQAEEAIGVIGSDGDAISDTGSAKDATSYRCSAEDAISVTGLAKDAISDTCSAEDAISVTGLAKDAISVTGLAKDATSDTCSAKDATSDTCSAEDAISVTGLAKDATSDTCSAEDAISDTGSAKDVTSDTCSAEDTISVTGLAKDATCSKDTSKETTSCTGSDKGSNTTKCAPGEAVCATDSTAKDLTLTGSSHKESRDAALEKQRSVGPARAPVLPRVAPPIPYHEPPWASFPPADDPYHLETLKNGVILSTLCLSGQTWFVFGRLPMCDVPLEHPSVSRYHAVLQYRGAAGTEAQQDRGFYMYDLGSSHGTFVNKKKIPPKTYCRLRVGHVMKLGGSTRLFILQGPAEDQESESELSVTQLLEARQRQQQLQQKMLGEELDEEPLEEETEDAKPESVRSDDVGCSWGMGDDAMEEEEEPVAEEMPLTMDSLEEREAYYVKDPRKALQGFLDREGEELECEYDDQGHNTWLCRIRLPVNDSLGKQLIAEYVHSGKKKEALIQCSLEACRMLDSRGLLRQEAISRKKRSKNWEEEDFYDSDDDTFLDRTGSVEMKRINRMKKAGRIEEKPMTYDSLVSKLNEVKYELSEVSEKLRPTKAGQSQSAGQDSLDAFMKEIRSGDALDSVSRKKLHVRCLELKKEQKRLEVLVKIVKPTALPELKPPVDSEKPKKLTLPMFGAMKGGKKFKLKTGAIGNLPPQRTNLPSDLLNMKGGGSEPEEEEEDDDVEEGHEKKETMDRLQNSEIEPKPNKEQAQSLSPSISGTSNKPLNQDVIDEIPDQPRCSHDHSRSSNTEVEVDKRMNEVMMHSPDHSPESKSENKKSAEVPAKKKKVYGPKRPPRNLQSTSYPEDDPDYCVWTPPAGQSGDGKTHLNDKYGY